MAVTPLRNVPPLIDTNELPGSSVTGALLQNGTLPLTGNWNAGAFNITASTFIGNLTGDVTGSGAGITGVVFQDGTKALTADWPAGDFNINSRNSVSIISADSVLAAAGFDPTNPADAAGTTATLNATLAAMTNGQTLDLAEHAYCISGSLNVGNGSGAGVSTMNAIRVIGHGPGYSGAEQLPLAGGTTFAWYGAPGGIMMRVLGPIGGIEISGINFWANPDGVPANAAGAGLEIIHAFKSKFSHLTVNYQSGYGFYLHGLLAVPGNATNCNWNLFDNCHAVHGVGTGYIGMIAGGTTVGVDGGCSTNTFVGCDFVGGSTGYGVSLRFCDNFSFVQTGISSANYGLVVAPPTGGTNFPSGHSFHNSFINGTISPLYVDTALALWAPPTGVGVLFSPWASDNGTVPFAPPHSGFKAIGDDGNVYMEAAMLSKNAAAAPSPIVADTQLQILNADGVSTVAELLSYGNAPVTLYRRAQGTKPLPTALQAGQGIINLFGYGYGATGWSAAVRAAIEARTTEIWTDAAQGTDLHFIVTATGGTTAKEPLFLNGTGAGFNTTAPSREVDLNGTQRFRGIAPPALSELNSGTIYFDSATNKLMASLNGGAYTPIIGSGGLTGSGAANTLPYWDAPTNLTNSAIIHVDGINGRLGFNVPVPLYKLDVDGSLNFTLTNGIYLGGSRFLAGRTFAAGVGGFIALGNGINAAPGEYTVTVGDKAGPLATGASNTLIGSDSSPNLTTGNSNVALGSSTGSGLTTGTRNVFLGASTGLSVGTPGATSNTVAIGYGVTTTADNTVVIGSSGMKVGITDNSPQTTLDVAGSFATRHANVVLVNGQNDDIAIPQNSFVRITGPTGAFGVSGFQGGASGRQLVLFNTTGNAMTIHDQHTSALTNQTKTLTGADVVLAARTSLATFIYDDSLDKWILCSYNG